MNLGTPVEVGRRIAQERAELGLTQATLSERIGITKSRLASYEDGRGCLRCLIALDICRSLFISEHWLATGEGDKNLYLDIRRMVTEEFWNKPFIDVYKTHLEPIYKKKETGTEGDSGFVWDAGDHPETIKTVFFKRVSHYSKDISDRWDYVRFFARLDSLAEELSDRFKKPPEDRFLYLDEVFSICGNDESEPFSYKRLFHDLERFGVPSMHIEFIAESLETEFKNGTGQIQIGELKKFILLELHGIDEDLEGNYAGLYSMLYFWDMQILSGTPPICVKCNHFFEEAGIWNCAAYPDGIPPNILNSIWDHTKPFPGDQGIQFEPIQV